MGNFYSWCAQVGNSYNPSYINDATFTVNGATTFTGVNVYALQRPTVTIGATTQQVASGQSVQLSATVTGPSGFIPPASSVDFVDSATVLASRSLVNSQATATLSNLTPGTYEINAWYPGSSAYWSTGSNNLNTQDVTYSTVTGADLVTVTGGTTPNWLNTLNANRATFGLPPVAQDPVLNAEEQLYTNYFAANPNATDWNSETPGNPAYSVIGAEIAPVSISSEGWFNLDGSVSLWTNSLYHSGIIMNPYIKVVGGAQTPIGKTGTGVAALTDGIGWPLESAKYPLTWPANGKVVQTNGFGDYEIPSPLAQCPAGWSYPTGPPMYIISTTAYPNITVTMTGSNGTTDPVCVVYNSSPSPGMSDPATSFEIGMLSKNLLVAGVTYTITVNYGTGSFSWDFIGKASTPPPPPTQPPTPPPTTPPPTTSSTQPLTSGVVGMAATPHGNGYWLVDKYGNVSVHGDAKFYGSMGGQSLNEPITHIVSTPDGKGYWLVAADGGVFAFGDAKFYGSMGGKPLNAPVVSLAPTPDGKGYWLVASDGGVFAFGDAKFYGSMGGKHLNAPVIGITATNTGYRMVASDGGIFSFGAPFYGSMGGKPLNQPIVGMQETAHGNGYWLVASDGGIFSFGSAQFHGSTGAMALNQPIVGMAGDSSTGGYWLVAADGGIFSFNAPFYGAN
ncbi:MAG: Ig-like domain repeat protein [Acidimicrobiales bacterium]